MRRRALLAGMAAWPASVRAQPATTAVLGLLHSAASSYMGRLTEAVRQGLAEQGYAEGRNLRIEVRLAEGHYERLAPLARELVAMKVDAILAAGGTDPVNAAKAATSTIPIVFVSAADPLKAGVVASLSRPGGNITGVSLIGSSLEPKRLEILGHLAPAGPLCAMVNPKYPDSELQIDSLQKAAAAMGRPLKIVKATVDADIDPAIATAKESQCTGLALAQDPLFGSRIPQIVAAAARQKLPVVYWQREFVEAGGLLSYGTNFADGYRQAGVYLGRILKGAKPADLPVMEPSRFELTVNLKTARALGFEVPADIVSNADEVIE